MSAPQSMKSNESTPVSVTILDEGGEAFTSVPPGYTITITSDAPNVVGVKMDPSGISAMLTSDDIGQANITISTTKPDGSHLLDSPDVTTITVENSQPNRQNVTFSAPVPE